ncbi:MAG: hypothetical protein JXR23_04170 [Pontiellaceae bacterium]|nr:hypothetical protein [Pontiellaceae bacterium]
MLLAWLPAISVLALDTESLLEDGPAKALLQGKKPILADVSGNIAVEFDQALRVLKKDSLLQDIQAAYGELLPENEAPEFTIYTSSTNAYYYINKKGERTDIEEVVRRKTSDDSFEMVYYSYGKRFFGKYKAVIHVCIKRDMTSGMVMYDASVYAYPENAFSRFFARHLGLVEDYFEDKTDEMTGIITSISQSLCKENEASSTQE